MEDKQTALVRRLYQTWPGRLLLKLLVRPWVSKLAGAFMDSRFSCRMIEPFITRNSIDMSDYEERTYRSFNDFFTRRVTEGRRPVSMERGHLVSPCDGLLSVHSISRERRFSIKGQSYTLEELLRCSDISERFEGGLLLKFRLTVSDYHRYHYPDNGSKTENTKVDGILNTVHPFASERRPIYKENEREYFSLISDNFGEMLYIQVGALLVGRICNNHGRAVVYRGEEAGCFEYGGSTVILCLERDVARLRDEFVTDSNEEIRVRMGETIGYATF